MDNYQEMYYKLFNRISDIIDELQTIQRETEEIFISRQQEQAGQPCQESQKPDPAN